jgi:hypothetical protein
VYCDEECDSPNRRASRHHRVRSVSTITSTCRDLAYIALVSILAFAPSWSKDHDLRSISRMAKETLILVPLGLPFFLPLAFADRL